MAVTARDRHRAYTKLIETIGEEADVIIELLPLQPASELATRADTAALAGQLRGEMAELRADLTGEMAELRAELRGEMAVLGADMRREMAELRAELKGDVARLIRWGAAVIVANGVAMITALAT